MKLSNIRIAVCAVAVLLALAAGSFAAANVGTARAAEWRGTEIAESYALGSDLELPARLVTVGNKTVKASATLIFPSGNATHRRIVTLNEVGKYTLGYVASVDGTSYVQTYSFMVYDSLIRFSQTGASSVTFGSWEQTPDTQGLMVRLAKDDTITFLPYIDVNDVTASDILVSAYATPDVVGYTDFQKIIYTFTDSMDPSVYLKVSARAYSPTYKAPSFYLAGGNGQPMEGYEASTDTVHVDNRWGAPRNHSFYGEGAVTPMDLRFDSHGMSVYVGTTMIIDLDDPKFFSSLWHGFPSGKVRLSIEGDMYDNPTANFCITQIRGLELSEEMIDDVYADEIAPEIEIEFDAEKYDTSAGTLPDAMVGYEYAIPAAHATDDTDGACEVVAHVYDNYTSTDNAVMLPVIDGKFRPTRKGGCVIVYEAADRSGNTAQKAVWVNVLDEVPKPVITEFGHASAKKEGVVGEWYPVPEVKATASSGYAVTKVIAVCGSVEYVAENGGFRPEKQGTYTVSAIATDFLGRESDPISYTVTVELGDKPLFADLPVLPRYLIDGKSYRLPACYANDYTTGSPVRKLASAEITDASGTHPVSAGGIFTPTVAENGGDVQIVFVCEGAKSDPIAIPAIKPSGADGLLKIENYLIADGVTVHPENDGSAVTATESGGEWMFANSLLAEGFTVLLAGRAAASDLTALSLVFEDAADPAISVVAEIRNSGVNATFAVGGKEAVIDGFRSEMTYVIKYENGQLSVGSVDIPIASTASGKPFAGFPSGKIYFSIRFENAGEHAAYVVKEIGGQPLGDSTTIDRVMPRLVLSGQRADIVDAGTVVTLPAALIADVLTPDVTASLTVRGPDGKPVRDVDGVELTAVDPEKAYRVKMDAYGQYSVTYTYADTNLGMTSNYRYAVKVEDTTAPVVTFTGSPAKVKVGGTLTVPSYRVTDNCSAAENVLVCAYAILPTGEMVMLNAERGSIVAERAGVYQFVIVATDEEGNTVLARCDAVVGA